MVEDGLHPAIIAQNLGSKAADTITFGNGDKVSKNERTNTLILPAVADKKATFALLVFWLR